MNEHPVNKKGKPPQAARRVALPADLRKSRLVFIRFKYKPLKGLPFGEFFHTLELIQGLILIDKS